MGSNGMLDVAEVGWLQLASPDGMRVRLVSAPMPSERSLIAGEAALLDMRGEVAVAGREGDLVGTLFANVLLAGSRFVEALSQHAVSGWRATPLLVAGCAVPLAILHITGRSGPIVSGTSEEAVGLGLPRIGQYLDAASWDGSDLFLAGQGLGILVAPPAARVLRGMRLNNVAVEPAGLEPLATPDGRRP